MENYNIITLGASGAGKTVFLASLFKEFSLPTDEGIYLEVHNSKQEKELRGIFAQIVNKEAWPRGTTISDGITKWNFTCCVRTPDLIDNYQVCQFNYIDFAGGIITDILSDEDGEVLEKELTEQIPHADAVIVLIDGRQLFKYIQTGFDLNDPGISKWLLNDLRSTIKLADKVKKKPLHFVITKWDLLEGNYDLSTVRECLESKCEDFKRLVDQRVRAGCPVRLIPISSVGKEFVTMQSDGSMKKKLGQVPKPFQLEIPISYVLIDKVAAYYNNVDQENKDFEKSVQHKFSFLLDLIPDAVKRGKLLTREERIQSLKKVTDAKTAFTYLIDTFVVQITEFEKNHPQANLGGEMKIPNLPSEIEQEDTENLKTWFKKQVITERVNTWQQSRLPKKIINFISNELTSK